MKTKQMQLNIDIPTAYESERAVLAYCIENATGLAVPEEFFYHSKHRVIARAIREVAVDGAVPDVTAVGEYLARNASKTGVSAAELVDFTMYASRPENLDIHIRNIKTAYVARRLYLQCAETVNNASSLCEPDVLREKAAKLQECITALSDVSSPGSRASGPIALENIMPDIVAGLEKGDVKTHIPTGLADYDLITGGLGRGDLVVVAARPGMGKTALALTIARNVAKKGHAVFIASLEMSREQIAQRLLAQEARVDLKNLRFGRLPQEELAHVMKIAPDVAALPILVDDTPAQTDIDIRFKARMHKPDVVIVDYLQLCKPSIKADRRDLEIAEITATMKAIAKECNCPVVLLSQLNREVEKRNNKMPQLSDLRDSGSIEQDADVIVFIYRDEYYNRDTKHPGTALLTVAKQRNGPTGSRTIGFWKHCTEFYCVEEKLP